MAFTDWDVDVGSTAGAYAGGDDGTDEQNANLANPLTLQGTDCREFLPTTLSNDVRGLRYSIDDGAYPAFASVPDTQAVSVRMWVRKEPEQPFTPNAIFLFVKGDQLDPNDRANGYLLIYGREGSGGMTEGGGTHTTLTLMLRGTSPVGSHLRVDNIATLAVDTWHQIRLDVIPTKNGPTVDRDTIRVYRNTGTEGSPIWTLLHEEVVLLSDPYAHPWGVASTRVGWGVAVTSTSGTRRPVYVDGFEALTKAIP